MRIYVDAGSTAIGAIALESRGAGDGITISGPTEGAVYVAPGYVAEFARAVALLASESKKGEGEA